MKRKSQHNWLKHFLCLFNEHEWGSVPRRRRGDRLSPLSKVVWNRTGSCIAQAICTKCYYPRVKHNSNGTVYMHLCKQP